MQFISTLIDGTLFTTSFSNGCRANHRFEAQVVGLGIRLPRALSSAAHCQQLPVHNRIQSKLEELHADFKQLEADLRDANQERSRARKDRIAGFKQALRDILEAADRADREWH